MATTTNYSWTTPDNTAYVKDGASAIRTLGSSVDSTLFTALGGAYPGMRLIKKQTIGNGVSSVQVTSAFSATYDNYKVIISGGVASGANYGKFILGAETSSYNASAPGATYTGSATLVAQNNGSAANYTWFMNTNNLDLTIDFKNPFLAKNTLYNFAFTGSSVNASYVGAGYQGTNTSHTSFTISSFGSETLTGGTIYVYGYGIS
jgi:hypothetical protein